MPSIYQFTRNTEEREMLKLGLVKPNSYARPYAMPPGVPRDRVCAVEAAFLKTLKDPEFVAEAEKTRMTLNPIPGATLHNMIVEGLCMPAALKEKLKADPYAEGLVKEPVAISKSVTFWTIGGEFFLDREIPREPEVTELFKKLVGAGPFPPH